MSKVHFYTWWGNSSQYSKSSYWTCVDERCRLAATLEGHTLSESKTGDNVNSTCQVCQKTLRGVYEASRSQESRERVEEISAGVSAS